MLLRCKHECNCSACRGKPKIRSVPKILRKSLEGTTGSQSNDESTDAGVNAEGIEESLKPIEVLPSEDLPTEAISPIIKNDTVEHQLDGLKKEEDLSANCSGDALLARPEPFVVEADAVSSEAFKPAECIDAIVQQPAGIVPDKQTSGQDAPSVA